MGWLRDLKECWCEKKCWLSQSEVVAIAGDSAPEQDICAGPFTQCSTRTGWWSTFDTPNWSPVYANVGNVPNTLGEYVPIGAVRKSPDCVTDVSATVHLGQMLAYIRRTRAYINIDVRLLCNGVVRDNLTYDMYHYIDERSDTNPDVIEPLQYRARPSGTDVLCCAGAPANSDLQVEARVRYRTVGAQSSDYFRVIAGLRSRASFVTLPRNLVIGRV